MPEETASSTDEPPVREFADRGTLWLLELPENARGLLQIVAADIAAQLDFSRAVRINRSFIPVNLQKQEADLLYRVPYRNGRSEILVYILLEHQSRPDRTMGLRLLSYILELWNMQKREWQDNKTPVTLGIVSHYSDSILHRKASLEHADQHQILDECAASSGTLCPGTRHVISESARAAAGNSLRFSRGLGLTNPPICGRL